MCLTTTISDNNNRTSSLLQSAPPPWHSIVLVGILLSVCWFQVPSWESLDQVATYDTLTRRLFPEILSQTMLGCIRLAIASVIFLTSIESVVLSAGWKQTIDYMAGSKLVSAPISLTGIQTMYAFTSVSWNILGCYFTLAGWLALRDPSPSPFQTTLLRWAMMLWETAGPYSLLVSAVVRYVIWPAALQSGGEGTKNFKNLRNCMMHNANVLFALSEAALLGGVPVRWSDVSFSLLVGIAYLVFSWQMSCSWANAEKVGPQFLYFFFDTTLPGYSSSIAILALMAVLLLFHGLFVVAENVLAALPGQQSVLTHVLFVSALCSLVMRFRD